MIILLIGSGAREHAIAMALNRASQEKSIHCLASNMNPGVAQLCTEIKIGNYNDPEFVCKYANDIKADLAIIGPESPLEEGVSDDLWKHGIKVVGPKKHLAQIETSKTFTRDLLTEYNIPACPEYRTFSGMDGVKEFLSVLKDDYVVKYDGLAGGKGGKVSGDHLRAHEEALNYCHKLVNNGGKFVVEKKLAGEEFSLMSFCDGDTLKHMPIVQDHKRAYEGDTGPNTGGMGTYSDANHSLPFLTDEDIVQAQEINNATVKALKNKFADGYKGILYGGFMATATGVKLIEYNARLGDPEAMNVLSLLQSDFLTICQGIVNGTLDRVDVRFSNLATVCKYAVPNGYPDKPVKGEPINLSNNKNQEGLFYASVDIKNGQLIEAGSRTAAVVGIANTISDAEKIAEKEISSLEGPLFHRNDIGTDQLIQKRVHHMESIR